jgi:microcystin-dependent protein
MAAVLLMSNNAVSLLSKALTADVKDVSVKITSGDETRFPLAQANKSWFPVTVIDVSGNREIMRCTHRNGVTLTVERNKESSGLRAFPINSRVEVRLTAAAFTESFSNADHLTKGEVSDARLPARLRPTQQVLPDGYNLNSVVATGRYFARAGVTNEPVVGKHGWLWVDYTNADIQHQEWQQYGGDERWRRQRVSGAWQAWEKIWNIKPDFIPIGVIFDYSGGGTPTGWLPCDGRLLNRADYAALYAVVGDRYKENITVPGTAFRIPDLRGRVTAGYDKMGGVSANRLTAPAGTTGGVQGDTLGAVGGLETHTLTEAQLAKHDHTITIAAGGLHSHLLGAVSTQGTGIQPVFTMQSADSEGQTALRTKGADYSSQPAGTPAGQHIHTGDIADAGSGTAHNNVQPTLIITKIIKYM